MESMSDQSDVGPDFALFASFCFFLHLWWLYCFGDLYLIGIDLLTFALKELEVQHLDFTSKSVIRFAGIDLILRLPELKTRVHLFKWHSIALEADILILIISDSRIVYCSFPKGIFMWRPLVIFFFFYVNKRIHNPTHACVFLFFFACQQKDSYTQPILQISWCFELILIYLKLWYLTITRYILNSIRH